MKKINTLLTVAFSILSLFGFSQKNNGKINGSVTDGNTKIIESATITLLKAKDSSIAKISASDKAGNFGFDNIANGKYFVSISAVAHQTAYSEVVEISETE
jgi:hypothetical protein